MLSLKQAKDFNQEGNKITLYLPSAYSNRTYFCELNIKSRLECIGTTGVTVSGILWVLSTRNND